MIYSPRGERRKVSEMKIYDMIDNFATEVREYMNNTLSIEERKVAESLYDDLVMYLEAEEYGGE